MLFFVRRSPGRSVPAAYFEPLTDSEGEETFSNFVDFSSIKPELPVEQIGASVARHEIVTIDNSDSEVTDDGKSGQILDELVNNEMLYDITMRGLNHLALSSGNRNLPRVVEDLCHRLQKVVELFSFVNTCITTCNLLWSNMRRRHQRLFHKLEQLRQTTELESARVKSDPAINKQHQ